MANDAIKATTLSATYKQQEHRQKYKRKVKRLGLKILLMEHHRTEQETDYDWAATNHGDYAYHSPLLP